VVLRVLRARKEKQAQLEALKDQPGLGLLARKVKRVLRGVLRDLQVSVYKEQRVSRGRRVFRAKLALRVIPGPPVFRGRKVFRGLRGFKE
jgi:hypothetical protein